MIKLFLIVLLAFAFMLAGIFFGDYKRVRTRFNREKQGVAPLKSDGDSCASCSGDCNK